MHPSAVCESCVGIWDGIVQSTTACSDESLGETPYRLLVRDDDIGSHRSAPAVDPHWAGPVDENVGDVGVVQELLQHSCADDFVDDGARGLEHLRGARDQ